MNGAQLRELREKLAISQQDLADRAGVSRNSVARQERGTLKIRPALAILYRLLEVLRERALPIIESESVHQKVKPGVRRRTRRRRT